MGELIGYAGCSTVLQDLAAQREALAALGVREEGIYLDRGPDRYGPGPARLGSGPGCRSFWRHPGRPPSSTGWSARCPAPGRSAISLVERGVNLSLGGTLYDPDDPMGKMFFNIVATFAEFEVDLLRLRTKEGKAIARARGRLKGRRPKLSARQQAELRRMHGTGGYTIVELMEMFSVGRATVYRVLGRDIGGSAATAGVDTA